ncbi:MAG: altronate dehydratase [Deltaproteobacteria bacterium]|nr:altronate dehydratase [Deltaproteobacteria bacterium]
MSLCPLHEKAIVLMPEDDVALARADIPSRTTLEYRGGMILVRETIKGGHKFALREIPRSAPVRKYGQIIGFATQKIRPGDHVHIHNLEAGSFARDHDFATEVKPPVAGQAAKTRTFLGFQRADGRVGTRNCIAVISTCNCSASVTRRIARHFRVGGLEAFPNVDSVFPVCHHSGCGMPMGGEDHERLQLILAGFATHPNIAGYLLVGLGCEMNQASSLVEAKGLTCPNLPLFQHPPIVNIQDTGGTQKAVEKGVKIVLEMLPHANEARRTPQPVSSICLATQCGGSDADSGITANPALGLAADELVRCGGTVILGETAELYGAEHLLTRRARDEGVGRRLLERIRWWETYTRLFHSELDNNLSPGNKKGGLTTIYEKSLGAVAKGGNTPLNAVYLYGERVAEKGLVMMDTPSHDPTSVTGMVAGGANVVVFTTGRGSVFGFKPAPVIKVASNSRLYRKMIGDMDINAGVVLEGEPIGSVGREIFERIIAVASGERTKSELQGLGEEEFVPWILGPMQ